MLIMLFTRPTGLSASDCFLTHDASRVPSQGGFFTNLFGPTLDKELPFDEEELKPAAPEEEEDEEEEEAPKRGGFSLFGRQQVRFASLEGCTGAVRSAWDGGAPA
jgi:hypothetical protein